jgi:hypothetical protein
MSSHANPFFFSGKELEEDLLENSSSGIGKKSDLESRGGVRTLSLELRFETGRF